jgi:hypothetical protein
MSCTLSFSVAITSYFILSPVCAHMLYSSPHFSVTYRVLLRGKYTFYQQLMDTQFCLWSKPHMWDNFKLTT